uniref:Uncharacterized protein n=1 Tax=Tanacetum cinerariifolium TaxID=118510 RepID=A0A6L2KPM9_TANCI|nr:hypothetical protein [Tanacetum cinerariifolium]
MMDLWLRVLGTLAGTPYQPRVENGAPYWSWRHGCSRHGYQPTQAQVENPESTLASRNRLRVTNEEPEHFGEDALPRPPGVQRIAKSQLSSNSTAIFGSNPAMFQEMMQQQYELDRRAKMEVIEREANARQFSKDFRGLVSATNRHTWDGSGRRGYR